jgi:hypothetical protein
VSMCSSCNRVGKWEVLRWPSVQSDAQVKGQITLYEHLPRGVSLGSDKFPVELQVPRNQADSCIPQRAAVKARRTHGDALGSLPANSVLARSCSKIQRHVVPLLLVLASPAMLEACPFCSSDTGAQVRALIARDFWANGIAMAMPFLVLLPTIGLLYRASSTEGRESTGDSRK